MARKMNLDNDALKGVGESKAEIKRRKRQEKKLKKFGIRDESKMGKLELFFYKRRMTGLIIIGLLSYLPLMVKRQQATLGSELPMKKRNYLMRRVHN